MGDVTRWEGPGNDNDVSVFLTRDELDALEFLSFVKTPKGGAVIYFGGVTRDSFEDKEVVELAYEAHIELALRSLTRIAKETQSRFNVGHNDVKIHKIIIGHRLGVVPIMEESVMIALSSTHRQEGWKAAEHILEEIKARVEIWKKEIYKDGSDTWKENDTSSVVDRGGVSK